MSERIRKLFTKIHKRYDFMNHLLSLGVDINWRGRAAEGALMPQKAYTVLDIAAGTGDLAIAVGRVAKKNSKEVKIYAVDFSRAMLSVAEKKIIKAGISNIKIEYGDALSTKYPDNYFDVVVSGFALRNFDDLGKFIRETRRILKKKGRFVLLDMARPDDPFQRAFFKFYFKLVKSAAYIVNRNAYSWLFSSIENFDKERLIKIAKSYGFKNVKKKNLITGVAFIITGEKG